MNSFAGRRALAACIGALVLTPEFGLAADSPFPTYARLETMEVYGRQSDAYLTEQTRSATKLDLSLLETPQSVSVITEAQMDDFAMHSLNDVLASTTGVNVQRVETDRTYYSARGFEIFSFQIDGLGLPLINNNVHGDVDTAIYERIEVLRGANGLMTGVGNPSATVNLARKRPTEDFRASVSGAVGSWDRVRAEADISGPLGERVRARVVAVVEDKESYLDRYASKKNIVYGVTDVDITNSTLLTVGVSQQGSEANGNLWGALPLYYTDGSPTNYDRSTSTSAEWSYWDVAETRAFVKLDQKLSKKWNLTFAYNHTETDEDSELFYVYGAPDPETELGLFGYASEYDLDDEQDFADLYVDGTFNLAGREHQLVMGMNWAELSYVDASLYDFTNGFPALPSLYDWTGKTVQMNFAEGATGSDVTFKQKAAYATGRFNLLDGLYVIAGARWNDWTSEGESYRVAENTEEDDVIPYLGVTYAISDSVTAYASYTEAFVAQVERNENDQRLPALSGKNYEAGVKAQLFDDKLLAAATVFSVEQNNLPYCVRSCGVPTPDTAYAPTDAKSEGIELEAVGEVNENWQLSAGYTYVDIESSETGALAGTTFAQVHEYTPEQTLRLSTTYQVPALPKLKVGAQVNWQDDIYRTQSAVVAEEFPNAGDPIITRQGAYALVDLMASYAVTDNVELGFNVKNLTDEST